MAIFSKFIDGVLFKGGILAAGVICMYLTRSDYLPRYIYPVSYGMTSIGILGLLVGLGEHDDEDDDPGFEERMAEFYRLKPVLEERLRDQARLMLEYERAKRRWMQIDELERDSLRFGERIAAYEARLAENRAPVEGGILRRRRIKHHSEHFCNWEHNRRTRTSSVERTNKGKLTRFKDSA